MFVDKFGLSLISSVPFCWWLPRGFLPLVSSPSIHLIFALPSASLLARFLSVFSLQTLPALLLLILLFCCFQLCSMGLAAGGSLTSLGPTESTHLQSRCTRMLRSSAKANLCQPFQATLKALLLPLYPMFGVPTMCPLCLRCSFPIFQEHVSLYSLPLPFLDSHPALF